MKHGATAISAGILFLVAAGAGAQNKDASIAYIYPAGGQRGTTFTATVGGQRLLEVRRVHVSGNGVSARVVEEIRPPKQEEFSESMTELRELTKRKAASMRPAPAENRVEKAPPWTDEDEDRLTELSEKAATYGRFREAPAIAERVLLEVTVSPNATPSRRTLRLETALGLTNPMTFLVGTLREVSAPPLTARTVMATVGEQRFAQFRRMILPESPVVDLPLPTVVNGQIGPGERDHYRFTGRKGQRIVIAVTARELSPYLADAVPGWFDAVVTVADTQGNELACADHWRFHPDPVLCFEVKKDGQYILEIADCLYRGREDFVYRATVGELPFATDVFPLGGRAGTDTAVQLRGWNLDSNSAKIPSRRQPCELTLLETGVPCLFTPYTDFSVDALPECFEAPGKAEELRVTLPTIANGRILTPGECDVYTFSGATGQKIVAEVKARRLGSPLDSMLRITDSTGKVLASNDDFADKGAGLVTHQADSFVIFTLPAAGVYRALVSDTQGKSGEAYAYRLRIGEPQPDYALRITPSALSLRRGVTTFFTAHAIRRDGFDGDIDVSMTEAPKGFVLGGGHIPASQEQVRMTLTVPANATPGLVRLELQGEAEIGKRRAIRRAVPAEDMMQAFAWRFLVPTDAFVALVNDGRGLPTAPSADDRLLRIPVEGEASRHLALPMHTRRGDLVFELNEPPAGITIARTRDRGLSTDLVLKCSSEAKAGLRGNLIVDAFLERTEDAPQPPAENLRAATKPAPTASTEKGTSKSDSSAPKKRRIPLGCLPAIPFEITDR